MMCEFVWTFNGVVSAISLGIVLLGFVLLGLGVSFVKLLDWWKGKP